MTVKDTMPVPTDETTESTAPAAEVPVAEEPIAAPVAETPAAPAAVAPVETEQEVYDRLLAEENKRYEGVVDEPDADAVEGDADDIAAPEQISVTRESLTEAGWTFTEEGTPVPPVATVKPADAPAHSAPIAAPAMPAAPETFTHSGLIFGVAPDGDSLYVEAFEDPESADALATIEAVGEAEYNRRALIYEIAKGAYEPQVQRRYAQAIPATVPAFIQQKNAIEQEFIQNDLIGGAGLTNESATAIVAQFQPMAQRQLETMQAMFAANFEAQGMPPDRAQARATLQVLSDPNSAKAALAFALVENLPAYGKALIEADRASRGEAAVVPEVPTRKPTPPAPGMSGGRAGGAPPAPRAPAINIDADTRRRAEDLGIDPQVLANATRGY